MAYRELFVVEVREILRRWVRGDSLRAIAAVVTADRKTVRGYVAAARGLGVVQGGEPPDDALIAQVIAAVHPGRPSQEVGSARALCRAHREIIAGWVEEGCNGPRVAELLERHTGQRVPRRTLGRFLAEELGTSVARSTVRVVDPEPGKVLEIDFMEARVWLGERLQKVYALVAVAARSRHLFVWPCQSMTRQDVIDALEAAWAYFGGVFPVVIVDNMRAVVARPDAVEPLISEPFQEYAQKRGFTVDPARVRRPQDKARVERAVPYVRASFFTGERFNDLAGMRAAASRWCLEVAGARDHGTTRRAPREAFDAEERALLLPPPEAPWDPPTWTDHEVGDDGAIVVEASLYSVPYTLRRATVRVRADRETVRVLHRGAVVKVHARVARGESRIDSEDLPPGKAELATRDVGALQARAQAQGGSIGEMVSRLLAGEGVWMRMRHVYRLDGLVQRYGAPRVNAACERALSLDVVDVARVARMLEKGLDGVPPEPPRSATVLRPRFGRDPSTYAVQRSDDAP